MSKPSTYHSFDIQPVAGKTALLVIDVQYLCAHRDYGIGAKAREKGIADQYEYYFSQIENTVVPNIQELLKASRQAGIQIIYPRIASLCSDGRDVSLQHKRIGLIAPEGTRESEVLDEIKPEADEIVLSKGASGVFNSTNIDQLLRNMGITTLIMTGVITNECVETAVRDASDLGYDVILVNDACTAVKEEYQRFALEILGGVYCDVKSTNEVVNMMK